MNGVKTETHVRVEQTARGIWYCSGVDVYGDNSSHVKVELDQTMTIIEAILLQHNGNPEDEKQHTDLSKAAARYEKGIKVKP